MKCVIDFCQKVGFQNESLNGVNSCLFIKAHKFVNSTTDSGINESEDGINIGTDFLNSGFNTIFNKVLFFDSPDIEKMYLEQFGKLFNLDTGEIKTSKNIFINLERIDVNVGVEFYQRYSNDGNGHVKGEFIRDAEGKKRIFSTIPVIVVCNNNDEPKENATALAKRNWDANLASKEDFSRIFVPVELYESMKKEQEEKEAAVKRAQVGAF